jgi:hypothetical protein
VPVDGTLEHRNLRTSFWERPHKITLVGTTDLPFGFRLGLTYIATSGAAYTYVLLGDPNADGFRPFSVHETTARLSKRFHLANQRTIEVTADLFNLLSFLDRDWGQVRQTPSDVGNVSLLELVGYDRPNGRGVYALAPGSLREVDVEASRWRLQLGATLFY